jgi:hypothetical protein
MPSPISSPGEWSISRLAAADSRAGTAASEKIELVPVFNDMKLGFAFLYFVF